MDLLKTRTLLWNLFQNFKRTEELRGLLQISESYLFCVKMSNHHNFVVEIESNCFMLERSHSGIHKVLKFLVIYCLSRKSKLLVLSYSTLKLFLVNQSQRYRFL